MSAEVDYLFRHAVLRDAAYQLQLPIERARLHAAAFAALADTTPAAPGPLAEDIADHARLGAPADPALAAREVAWLDHAAKWANQHFEHARELELLRRAVQQAGPDLRPSLQLRVASVLGTLARHDEARTEALAHADSGDPSIAMRATGILGRIELTRENLGAAETLLRNALSKAESQGDTESSGKLLNNLGLIAFAREDDATARELFTRSLECARQAGNRAGVSTALGNLARVSHRNGNIEQATLDYEQAIRAAEDAGDATGLAHALGNMALMLAENKRATEAEPLFQRALALHRRHGDRGTLAAVLINYSVALEGLGRNEEALAVLREAIELAIETATPTNQVLARSNLVVNLLRLKKFEEARREFDLAAAMIGRDSPQWLKQAVETVRDDVERYRP